MSPLLRTSWLLRRWSSLCLVAIVLGAVWLSTTWVFLIPIYQAPDEHVHSDYAFCILTFGRILTAWDLPLCLQPGSMVHPYTNFLHDYTGTAGFVGNPARKVPADYGTTTYFATLDRHAPPEQLVPFGLHQTLFLLSCYLFGYYALLATWLGVVRWFSGRLAALFFAGRLFSVALLAGSLLLGYATLRRLNLGRGPAIGLTAAVGWFPLTSFVSSAIQPDNLALLLVSLCLYLTLRARSQPDRPVLAWLTGAALGALLLTKLHFFACVLTASTAALLTAAARGPSGMWTRLRTLAALTVPPALLGTVYLWTVWGVPNHYGQVATAARHSHWLAGLRAAFVDYFCGTTHQSFWGVFGWMDTPLVIGNHATQRWVSRAIQTATWGVLALGVLRLGQVAFRLARLARAGRGHLALRIACANPVLNSFFLFTLLMFYLYVRLDNQFGAQGRHWFPFVLPIFLTAVVYAPRALPWRSARRFLSAGLCGGLLLYCLVGSYYALRCVEKRYYPRPTTDVLVARGGPHNEKGKRDERRP
jgi:hypothetical protein